MSTTDSALPLLHMVVLGLNENWISIQIARKVYEICTTSIRSCSWRTRFHQETKVKKGFVKTYRVETENVFGNRIVCIVKASTLTPSPASVMYWQAARASQPAPQYDSLNLVHTITTLWQLQLKWAIFHGLQLTGTWNCYNSPSMASCTECGQVCSGPNRVVPMCLPAASC